MTSNPTDLKRRKFLLTAGAGGAGAVTAAIVGSAGLLPTEAVLPAATQARTDSGYQATEHVRNYYRTARV